MCTCVVVTVLTKVNCDFNEAKYNLGKVRLKPMQSTVSPGFIVRNLRGGTLETCRAFVSCCIAHAVLRADLADHLQCIFANLCGFLPFPLPPCWLLVSR